MATIKKKADKKRYAKLWLDLADVMDRLYADSSLHYWDEVDNMMNTQWTIAELFCPKRILNSGERDQNEIREYAKSLIE